MAFRGAGGRRAGNDARAEDTLFSKDTVEVILAISEGEIQGLQDGAKTFYLGDTPLQNSQGETNFDDFDLDVYKGIAAGQDINPKLGGTGSSTTVSTTLATDVPVVRTGTETGIDFLDVRLVVSQLVKVTEKGSFKHTGEVKVEYKAVSDVTWTSVSRGVDGLTEDTGQDTYRGRNNRNRYYAAYGDRWGFLGSSEPSEDTEGSIWFDAGNGYRPHIFDGASYVEPGDLDTDVDDDGDTFWTWSEDSIIHRAWTGFLARAPRFASAGDYWIRSSSDLQISNGSSWNTAGNSLGNQDGSGATIGSGGVITFDGKVSSTYVEEIRIPVERIDEAYEIRVTKLTEANTEELFFDVAWESFQEITAGPINHPDLAIVRLLGTASNQFSSIPQFWGVYEGRIVKVPSNYNAETGVYTGVWDGTWQLAFSSNQAYIVNDLVENDRYGLNAYYPVVLNKWDVYDFGVWCDTLVGPNDRRRYTFNALIQEPRSAKDLINYICGTAGARFLDDGNGTARIMIDQDEEAIALFTPENVIDGVFTYSFSDILSRSNDITVTFINPALNWAEDRRRVYSQTHIDRYGRIPADFIAVGCTDPIEAVARGNYKLITATTETGIVNFKTNRQGLFLSPYKIILIADEDDGTGLTGRVKAVTGAATFSLRDTLYLEPGIDYVVKFQTPTGVVERAISALITGARTSITTTTDLPTLPEYCVFSIEAEEEVGVPRAYRVLDITEGEDHDTVEITAVEVNRLKQTLIDDAETDEDILDHLDLGSTNIVSPTEIRITPSTREVNGKLVTVLTISWERSTSPLVRGYRLYDVVNGGARQVVTETAASSYELVDPYPGDHVFSLTAIGFSGKESYPPLTIPHQLAGESRAVDPVEDLALVDETYPTVFESVNPKFQWTASSDPYLRFYVVTVYDGATEIRTELLTVPEYVYDQAKALTDFAGDPPRSLTISVICRDMFGYESAPAALTVTNPPPAAPAETFVDAIPGGIIVHFDPPAIRDFAGMVIYAGQTSGDLALVHQGPGLLATIPIPAYGLWYVQAGFYDAYSTSGLVLGAEVAVFVPMDSVVRFDNLQAEVRDQIENSLELQNLADAVLRVTSRVEDSSEFFSAYFVETIAVQAGVNEGFALQFTELGVRMTDAEGDITASAGIISSHTASLIDLDGDITAVASSVSSLTTVVGGNTASISTISTTVGGHAVRYGIVGSINGVTGGFILEGILMNDGSVSYTVEIAGVYIQDGAISANKLAANSVVAGKIAAGTIVAADIASNVITAQKLQVGLRGVETAGIDFTATNATNVLSWTAGVINYTDDAGASASASISSGNVTWTTGTRYIYWVKAATTISTSTTRPTGANDVILATYRGGRDLSVVYGATIIDGNKMITGSITATQLAVDSITATKIVAGSVETAKIAVGGVETDRIANNAVTQLGMVLTAATLNVDSEVTVQTLVSTRSSASELDIDFYCEVVAEADDTNVIAEINIKRGSTTLFQANVNVPVVHIERASTGGGGSGSHLGTIWRGGLMRVPYVDTGAVSGSTTYTVTMRFYEASASTVTGYQVKNRYLRLLERSK